MKEIVIALISAVSSIVVVILQIKAAKTNKSRDVKTDMHSAKQSILQLILEDKISVLEGKLPENRKDILLEFDEYIKNNGNHYMERKVKDYEKWYEELGGIK